MDDDARPGRDVAQAAQTRYRTLAQYELPLALRHPASGEPLCLEAAAGADWQRWDLFCVEPG